MLALFSSPAASKPSAHSVRRGGRSLSATNPPTSHEQHPMYQFASVLGQAFGDHMQSSGEVTQSALTHQREEMLHEERLRANLALKAAADERLRADLALKVAADERAGLMRTVNEERTRRDNQLAAAQSQAAVLNSSILMAAISNSGLGRASSAGPAHSAKVRSATEATLITWLVLNDILAADSEWDTKALINEGCTQGQDILMMEETDWAAVGFRPVAVRKLKTMKLKNAA